MYLFYCVSSFDFIIFPCNQTFPMSLTFLLPHTIKAQKFTFTNSRCHHIQQIYLILAFNKSIVWRMLNFKCQCWICHSVFQARVLHNPPRPWSPPRYGLCMFLGLLLSRESHPRRSFHHCLLSLQDYQYLKSERQSSVFFSHIS